MVNDNVEERIQARPPVARPMAAHKMMSRPVVEARTCALRPGLSVIDGPMYALNRWTQHRIPTGLSKQGTASFSATFLILADLYERACQEAKN
jgi:hypothetical protein